IKAIDRSMAVIEFNLDGEVVSANQNFLDLMGYTRDEVIGQHHRMFCLAEDSHSDDYREFWARLNKGEFMSDRFRRVTKHGRQVWLRATYNPLYDANGRVYGVVKFASDITTQVERRDSEAAAAQLAHDIAKETDVSADHGTRTVAQTVAVVNDIASELANVAEQIEGLNKQSEQITSIVQVIRGIA
ncbi:PAS domain-containing protein, partial [Bowmanella yangjiangensis]